MRAFHILLDADEPGSTTRVDFDAEGRDFALTIAASHAGGRSMELWEGGVLIGSLDKSAPQLWRLPESLSKRRHCGQTDNSGRYEDQPGNLATHSAIFTG